MLTDFIINHNLKLFLFQHVVSYLMIEESLVFKPVGSCSNVW